MTVENAVQTIRSDPTMEQAGFQCGLSRSLGLGSGRGRFFLLLMSTKTIDMVKWQEALCAG